MFKKLRHDKNKIIAIYFFETIIAITLVFLFFYYKNKGIEFVDKYSMYCLILLFIIFIIFNLIIMCSYLKKSEKYLNRTDITIASLFGNEVSPVFEFGDIIIFVYNEADEVIWLSQTTLLKKEDILGQKVYDLIPDFDELTIQENNNDIFAKISGKTFKIEINTSLKVIYLKDVSAQVIQDEKMEQERPFIGHIVIDNYQDVIVSLNESEFVLFATSVKEIIMAWAKSNNLFIRSYGNDSFLIIGEEKNYINILKNGFSVLDEVREKAKEDDNPLTISIGIGKGNTTSILRTSELSYIRWLRHRMPLL